MTSIVPAGSSASLFAAPVSTAIALPTLALAEDEQIALTQMMMRLFEVRPHLELRNLYYDGLQKMQDLGISIPPSLAGLRTVMGWPQIGIDSIDERCQVEGFRYGGSTVTDDDLWNIWQDNNFDGESNLAQIDALIYGRCYLIVGPNDEDPSGSPLITAESPINMYATWSARTRRATAALQLYLDTNLMSDTYGQQVACLYLNGRTIHMSRDNAAEGSVASSRWEIIDRDDHGQPPPVIRMANRQRLSDRGGQSEITAAWMNVTDAGCRTMLGMEVGREFFATPRRYVLGASEEAFQKADGTPVSAWETYMQKILALPYDEEGNIPTVGEFKSGDPSTFTKILDTYARLFSGLTALPPYYYGLETQGNPASADAIRSNVERHVRRCIRKMTGFGEAYEEALRTALVIRDGKLRDGAARIETDWRDPYPQTPAETTDAITKQISAGAVPANSDVALKRLGYSAVERARIAEERAADEKKQAEVDARQQAEQLQLAAAQQTAQHPAGPPAAARNGRTPVPAPPRPRD